MRVEFCAEAVEYGGRKRANPATNAMPSAIITISETSLATLPLNPRIITLKYVFMNDTPSAGATAAAAHECFDANI